MFFLSKLLKTPNLKEELFPPLKLKKLKNQKLSMFQKINIYFEAISFIVLMLWIVTFFGFKELSNKYDFGTYLLYSLSHYDAKKIETLFDAIDRAVTENSLNKDTESPHDKYAILMVNNDILYYILNPFAPNSFASTLPNNTVIVKKSDNNLSISYTSDKNENLHAIISHELVHIFQHKKYGWFTVTFKTPTWAREGYATYATKDLYIDSPDKVLKEFNDHYPDMQSDHISAEYKLWMLMVGHAIEDMNKSVDDLHLGKVEYDEVLASLLRKYNIKR